MKTLAVLALPLLLLIGNALYAAPIVANPSFEIGPFPGAPGYGVIDSWTRNNTQSGLNTATGPFVSAAVPDGTHAAFLQSGGDTTISQSISGFELGGGGFYQLVFWASQRASNRYIDGRPDLEGPAYDPGLSVLLDSTTIVPRFVPGAIIPSAGSGTYWTVTDATFHQYTSPVFQNISGTTHTLTFYSFAGPGSDWTHNVDMVSLIQVPEPVTLSLLALGGLALLRRRR